MTLSVWGKMSTPLSPNVRIISTSIIHHQERWSGVTEGVLRKQLGHASVGLVSEVLMALPFPVQDQLVLTTSLIRNECPSLVSCRRRKLVHFLCVLFSRTTFVLKVFNIDSEGPSSPLVSVFELHTAP